MQQVHFHRCDEKGVRELITALKVQIVTVSMPLREENRDGEEEREREGEREREIGVSKVISTLQHNGSVKHS